MLFEGVCLHNYRHPDLCRVRNLGCEQQVVSHFGLIRQIGQIRCCVPAVSIFAGTFCSEKGAQNQRSPLNFPGPPKGPLYRMVLGHNLHHMAPFGISRPGFCMVFQRASVFVFMPGDVFGARDWIFGSWVNILTRGPFWVKSMSRK